jgi:hypothetical protein
MMAPEPELRHRHGPPPFYVRTLEQLPMKSMTCAALVLASFILPTTVSAQIAWEAPLLVAPNAPVGVSLMLAEMSPHDGLAGLVAWRGESAPGSLGLRAGAGEGAGGSFAAFAGLDFSGWILRARDDMPIDIAWVTGVGLGAGNYVLLSAPLGASFAYEVRGPDLWFNPYVTPYLVLDAALGNDRPSNRDDLDLGIAVDIGADLAFSSEWAIRFAASLGDRQALAIGLHLPGVALAGRD